MERVFASLVRGLIRRGVQVAVFAHPDSFQDLADSPAGRNLVQVPTHAPVGRLHPQATEMHHTRVAARLISAEAGSYDVVHDHTRFGAVDFAGLDIPALTTAHYDPTRDPFRWTQEATAGHPYVALSQAQKRSAPDVSWLGVVPNGIDQDFFRPGTDRFGYLLHIAALGTRKGTDLAIRIARAAGRRLVVMGSADRADPEGFAKVQPMLAEEHVTWLDEQAGAQKLAWLQGAAALVHPIQWEEPFGLVYVEALACGVPVLTLDRGAAREVVRDGEAGVVAGQWTDLIGPAREAHRWPAEACRDTVAHLTEDAMVEAYLKLYEGLIDRANGPTAIPRQRRATSPLAS